MAEPTSRPPGAPLPPAERDEEIAIERRTLRDYYIMMRERLWIALPLAILVAVGYAYNKLQVTPLYSATATMQFEKPERIVLAEGVVDTAVRSELDINTNTQVLRSGWLREKVMASFTPDEIKLLQRAALKRRPPGSPPTNIGIPMGSLDVAPVRNTYLISISVTHEDPEAAALIANRYVDMFMNYLYETAGGRTEDAVRFLKDQAARLERETQQKDQALQHYMQEHHLTSIDISQDMVADALKKVVALRDDARLRLLGIQDKVNQVEAYQKAGKNLYEIGEIATHGSVPVLRAQLSAEQQEMNLLSERYYERHPKMIDVMNRIDVTQQALDKATQLAVEDLKARLADAQQTYDTYVDEVKKREQDSMRLGELRVEFNSLVQQAQVAKANYQDILKRLNDTTTVKNVEKIPLHPLDRAAPNYTPVSPNRHAITRTAIGLGILVFIGVAVGLSFIDDRIKSAWDVESFIGVNLLGIIPDLTSIKDEEKYALLLENRQAPGVEAFLSVYSSIKIQSKLDFPKSILVTSTIPGEGKTLISCNVAGCFARHGKRTLLVDCDLRRPMLHRHFKQQNTAGLITWFEAGAMLEGNLTTHPSLGIIKVAENLWLLCSGGRSKSPTEILENPVFSQLLERLKKEFDLVLVDSPPLGAVTDSVLIAERVDEVVYVCRFNRAYRKHIRLYMRTLRQGKNEVLGIVLNGLSPRRIEYYSNYRYYRSYKKYYGAQT
ncbi:MAG TPA: polysaccharide biosynthesis tyrosine autokinase [Opitutaceae bacterium]|nr:polysaccharide biosynthesis tyrosine autokinase [Opitutaceae bacterium]